MKKCGQISTEGPVQRIVVRKLAQNNWPKALWQGKKHLFGDSKVCLKSIVIINSIPSVIRTSKFVAAVSRSAPLLVRRVGSTGHASTLPDKMNAK